ncbi:MAG: DNA double-strand break repair nuclease NurA [Candidatus Korarchaeota archaeon]|nr:DNA double-strand break repair nuclease NurA [Candidatus Korarchaeota archaeon]NIU81948.1 DNA double-strand break repair nuclease NurA [Candidatus Thorarchaeota archaeon]NIW12405.1 DNA double-strand break repair nuclease NurA [Candidatus Thorarchaeota archaeon]NIW51198.1 DNA double-strand break repair nuclease NurA [Candidatus Korarchaeota archaeon]
MSIEETTHESPLQKWIEDVIATIDKEVREKASGKPIFNDPRYHPKALSAQHVHSFPMVSDSERKMAFIDGGSRHLLVTPSFCVSLVRVYFSLFDGLDRQSVSKVPRTIDFYVVVRSRNTNNDIEYRGKLFPKEKRYGQLLPKEQDLHLNSWDRSIMAGKMRAPIERIASAARRFAEWKLAAMVASDVLDAHDIIVRDGSLQTTVTNEATYAEQLYDAAKEQNVIVTGVAKTSRLYTDSGNSLLTVIRRLGEKKYPANRWYYYPVVKIEHPDHKAELYYVKFHPQADYVFRFEIYRDQARAMSRTEQERILGTLARNSRDITFPGYPYGLIDADRFSRIRSDEVENHIAMLKAEASKNGRWERLKKYLHATNAHDKLNEVVGV